MSQLRSIRLHSAPRSVFACAGALALAVLACASPSSSADSGASLGDGPAPLSLGATEVQAREGNTSTFVLESTPDLVLYATLRDSKYEGETLQIRGVGPDGTVIWSYPHLQKGSSFDAILPVFGSAAARKRILGSYSFEVVAPDRTVIASGGAQLTSARGSPRDAGGALYRVSSPAATSAVAARDAE